MGLAYNKFNRDDLRRIRPRHLPFTRSLPRYNHYKRRWENTKRWQPEAAFTHVQGKANSTGGATTLTTTFTSTPTVGNLICAAVSPLTAVTALTVADVAGSPHSFVVTPNSPSTVQSGAGQVWMAYLLSAPSGTTTGIKASWTTSAATAMYIEEFSYTGGTLAFDNDAKANSGVAGTAINTPTITPAVSGELLYAMAAAGGTISAPTSNGTLGVWTGSSGAITNGDMAEFLLSSTNTSTAVNFTQSNGTWSAMVMAFQIVSATVNIVDDQTGDNQWGTFTNTAYGMINIAEAAIGDFPEAPPKAPVMDWTDELNTQLPKEYWSPAFSMLQIAESALGDSPEVVNYAPGVIAGHYLDEEHQISTDFNNAYGMLNIAEAAIGDNAELITLAPGTIFGWTDDEEQQKLNDWNASYGMINIAEAAVGDNPEAINYAPGTVDGWDTDADNQINTNATYAQFVEYDDRGVRIFIPVVAFDTDSDNQLSNDVNNSRMQDVNDNTIQLFIPTQELDTDSEQQFSTAVDSSKLQDPEDRVLRIFIPIQEIDNDSEQQLSNAVDSSKLQDPDDRAINIITPTVGYDNDSDNQISTDANVARMQEVDDRTIRIFIPTQVLDNDGDQQLPNYIQVGNIASDSGQDWTQFIVVPVFDPSVVPQGEELQAVFDFFKLYQLDEDRSMSIILPFNDWTLDVEQQKANPEYSKDHLSDEGVEKITIPPVVFQLNAFDTDADTQLSNQVNFSNMQEVDDRQINPPTPPSIESKTDLTDYPGNTTNQFIFVCDDQGNIEKTGLIILVPFIDTVEVVEDEEDN